MVDPFDSYSLMPVFPPRLYKNITAPRRADCLSPRTSNFLLAARVTSSSPPLPSAVVVTREQPLRLARPAPKIFAAAANAELCFEPRPCSLFSTRALAVRRACSACCYSWDAHHCRCPRCDGVQLPRHSMLSVASCTLAVSLFADSCLFVAIDLVEAPSPVPQPSLLCVDQR